MTTSVTVKACCDPKTTQVRVDMSGHPHLLGGVLQDGETATYTIYGGIYIAIREVSKAGEN